MTINDTNENGAIVDGKFITWELLRRAAKQEDADLAAAYSDILQRAARHDERRIISEDWKTYGYPLRTGFSQRYRGQIVMRAWEIRRVRRAGKDLRVAYILTWDRSDNTTRREASPEFADYEQAADWVLATYGGWHDELGGERTASTWLYA